jgi:Mg2+/Co2+ transporter CorC
MTKTIVGILADVFLFNNISEGLFMNKYYVVLRTKEKDELLDVVDALSLEEAMAIAETRYEEQMEVRDGLFVFEVNSPLVTAK